MPRKFDKARRARASRAAKTRELIIAIKNTDRILARNLILKDKIRIPKVTRQDFARFLRTAVESRDVPLVRALLLETRLIDATVGAELLWQIIHDVDTRIAEMLVRAGADVNNKSFDRYSRSLLHVLAKSKDNRKFELAVLMMKHGADVRARDVDEFSVLEEAIHMDNYALAGELLRRGVTIDEDVLWAVVNSRDPVKWVLMIVNGDHVEDASTKSFLLAAVFNTLCSFDFDEDQLVNMTRALFDLEIPNVVVILQAVRYKRIGVMKSLWQRSDIDENAKMTFLHCATTDPLSSEMARLLVEWGADIDYPLDLELEFHSKGMRPLHVACRYESVANIQLLLQLGADVNARDDQGNTPFSCTNDDNLTMANRLMIKHFAMLTWTGDAINVDDLARIAFSTIFLDFYYRCWSELRVMREFRLFNRITFYTILIGDAKTLMTLARRRKFLDDYENNVDYFPVYRCDLDRRFQEAMRLRASLEPRENALYELLREIVPDVPLEVIVDYMYLNEVEILTRGPLLCS